MTSGMAGERCVQHPVRGSAGRMTQDACGQASPRPRPSPSRQYGCSFGPSYCTTVCRGSLQLAIDVRACNTSLHLRLPLRRALISAGAATRWSGSVHAVTLTVPALLLSGLCTNAASTQMCVASQAPRRCMCSSSSAAAAARVRPPAGIGAAAWQHAEQQWKRRRRRPRQSPAAVPPALARCAVPEFHLSLRAPAWLLTGRSLRRSSRHRLFDAESCANTVVLRAPCLEGSWPSSCRAHCCFRFSCIIAVLTVCR